MPSTDLRQRIERGEATIGVIGLGYVGLPVACTFAHAGFDVIAVDVREDRVEAINSGRSVIKGEEPGLTELLSGVVASGRLHATTEYLSLAQADAVLIAVQTPVDDQHKPATSP